MDAAAILKIIIIVTGIFLLIIAISSLAKRVMHESFCLAWGVVSVAIIVAGIVLNPTQWSSYVSKAGLFLILLIFFTMVYAAYFASVKISELTRKNQELAIQVSLLNEQTERLTARIDELSAVDKTE